MKKESLIDDILDLIIYENEILKKKIHGQKLMPREEFFINYVVSPSFMLKMALTDIRKKEGKKKNV